jgi:hypothetical protein
MLRVVNFVGVAELVDALVSKSNELAFGGSIPPIPKVVADVVTIIGTQDIISVKLIDKQFFLNTLFLIWG